MVRGSDAVDARDDDPFQFRLDLRILWAVRVTRPDDVLARVALHPGDSILTGQCGAHGKSDRSLLLRDEQDDAHNSADHDEKHHETENPLSAHWKTNREPGVHAGVLL